MPVEPRRIDRAFEALVPFLQTRPELEAEFRRSIGTFFHGTPGGGAPHELLLAARRHMEWFALEHPSPTLDGTPVQAVGEAWLERTEPEAVGREELARCLRDSISGVFEVTGVQAGEGAWLRDLAGYGEYPVAEAAGAEVLESGDLIVGRLFPLGDGAFHVSRAAGFYRNPALRAALVRDLDEARELRGGKVLHVAQADLEAMFWRGREGRGEESEGGGEPEAELRELLARGGVGEQRTDAILARLASIPFDPSRLVHGSGDALGEILDELAFDTEVDLEGARRLLVRVWSRSARVLGPAGGGSAKDGDGGVDARAALEAFERGRRAGADLETLFRALEEDLELEPGSDEEDHPAPDFPGVVGAMVEEFLWETGLNEGEDVARRREVLRPLGRFGASIGTFDNLSARDLLQFTSFWLLEERVLESGAQARDLVEALRAFCGWAEEAHELPLLRDFESTLDGLEQSLPRVVEANRSLGRAARDPGDTGELLTFLGEHGGLASVRDGSGLEHRVRVRGPWLDHVEQGDPMRGRVQIDDSLSVFCCYPPEATQLVG